MTTLPTCLDCGKPLKNPTAARCKEHAAQDRLRRHGPPPVRFSPETARAAVETKRQLGLRRRYLAKLYLAEHPEMATAADA